MKKLIIASSVALTTALLSFAGYAKPATPPTVNPKGTFGSQITGQLVSQGPGAVGAFISPCASGMASTCPHPGLTRGDQVLQFGEPGASTFGQSQPPN